MGLFNDLFQKFGKKGSFAKEKACWHPNTQFLLLSNVFTIFVFYVIDP